MMYRDFWKAGYKIFPLYGANKDGSCQCGDPDCEAVFKHPRISQWSIIPLFDEDVINDYEEFGQFATGYGVLCSGLLVIDVDARNGGVESVARLIHEYPSINESRLEVATGSGGGSKHIYFRLPEPIALIQSHTDYPGIDFKSSGYVVGPGSRHASGGTYEADGYPEEITDAPSDLIDLLRKPERHRTDYNGTALDLSHSDISEILAAIPNNGLDYEIWVRVGMAVHHATGGTGYDLWESWSATSDKHDDARMPNKWHSFGRAANPATIGTLIHHAQENGWVMPIRMMDGMGDLPELSMKEPEPVDGLPFDISGIDLTQPPGFVGDVARWIESQSRRPRRHLAAAAAVTAIGNIAGLRYTDDRDGVTTNMLTFCVAASRTGKESIQQAVYTLHRAAGIMPASHGGIKSEQEIVKNLTRHQASFYVIDEIGLQLQKIQNAIKRGGAVYLEGVIAMIMSVQSKAHGYMMLNGDLKEKLREDLSKELGQVIKKMDLDKETPYLLGQQTMLEHALANVDQGLDRPFLSLIGFTTPSTFESLVDRESATNGFFGRAVLFQEHDTVPRLKDDFAKKAMDDSIEMTVRQIFSDGHFDGQQSRIENYSPRSVVPSDFKSLQMLDAVGRWMQSKAEDEASRDGLEALWLGAYEIVSKISLILAVPGMLRTAEHVRWAFAVVKRDVESKIRLAIGNDAAKPKKNDALRARIEALCQEPIAHGTIMNRLERTFAREDITKALEAMVKGKALTKAITIHSKRKTEIIKYEVRH
jgi:hypothetical protein